MRTWIAASVSLLALAGCGSSSVAQPHLVAAPVVTSAYAECADHSPVRELPDGTLYCGLEVPPDPGSPIAVVISPAP